uniref:VWFA domain-containing protein n=1 Tax=Parastrongyloides trichosuri TaxID=131310 RepID=A0A0N5A1K3_PARTI
MKKSIKENLLLEIFKIIIINYLLLLLLIKGDNIINSNDCKEDLPIQAIFLVDITNHNITSFEEQKFKAVQSFDILKTSSAGRNLSISVVTFHRRPILLIDLESSKSRRHSEVREQIKKIKARKRKIDSYPAGGIEFTKDVFIKSYIPNSKRLVFMVHDGNNTDLINDIYNAKNNLNKLKADIFIVTSNNVNNVMVENLLPYSESDKRIYGNDLGRLVKEIQNSLEYCENDYGLQVFENDNKVKFKNFRRRLFASKISSIHNNNPISIDNGFKCNNENVDLIVLLDTTGMSRNQFENEKGMVVKLVEELDNDLIDSEVLQISIISFCDVSTIHLPFNLGKYNKNDILKAIHDIEYTGNTTYISKGIESALDEFRKSNRKNTKQFLVLFSDGHGMEYWHKVKSTAKKLNDFGCELFATSTSSNYNAVELKMYTGGNGNKVYVGRKSKNLIDALISDMNKCFSNSPNIKLQAELNRGLTSTKVSTTTTSTTTTTTELTTTYTTRKTTSESTSTTSTTTTTTPPPTTTTELSLAVILERGVGKFIGNPSCKSDPVDVMIILDVSTSITHVFERQKQVALDLLQVPSENDYKNRIRVGLVTFNQGAKLQFNLSSYRSKEEILSKIYSIRHTGGQTSLLSGVNRAIEELIGSNRKNGTKLVTLIISDGNSRDNWGNVIRGAKRLKDLECIVYSVTASEFYHYNELKEYAGSKDRVFLNGYTPKFIINASKFLFGCDVEENDFVRDEKFEEFNLSDLKKNNNVGNKKHFDSEEFEGKASKLDLVKNANKDNNKNSKSTESDEIFDFTTKSSRNLVVSTSLITTEENKSNEDKTDTVTHTINGHLIEGSGDEDEMESSNDEIKTIEIENRKVKLDTRLIVQTTTSKSEVDSRHENLARLSKKFNLTNEEQLTDDEGRKVNVRGQTIVDKVKDVSKEKLNKFAADRSDEYDENEKVEELPNVDEKSNRFGDIKEKPHTGGFINKGEKKSSVKNNKSIEDEKFLPVESSVVEVKESKDDINKRLQLSIDVDSNLTVQRTFPDGCKVDLLFVIDSSQSVDNSFEKQLQLAIDLVKQIPKNDFNDRVKIGALSFTRVCETKIELGQYTSKDDIINGLMKIKHLGGGTSVVSGLKMAIKTYEKSKRSNAMQLIVLLSDGNSFDNWRDVVRTAKDLRYMDVTLFAISLSQNYYLAELQLYAGNKWFVYVDGRVRQFLIDVETTIQRCTGPMAPKDVKNRRKVITSITDVKMNKPPFVEEKKSKTIEGKNDVSKEDKKKKSKEVEENELKGDVKNEVIKDKKNETNVISNIKTTKKPEVEDDFNLNGSAVMKIIESQTEKKSEKTIDLTEKNINFKNDRISNIEKHGECGNDLVDLVILLDVSASILKEFYEEKSFVTDLIKILPNDNFEDRFRLSLTTFNKKSKKVISLKDSMNRNDILYEVDRIMQASGGTSLTAAAEEAINDIIYYKRKNSRLVTVIVSDGNSQDEWEKLLMVSKKLKDIVGKDIYAVTLSPKYYFEELKEYVPSEDNIFVDEKINNFLKHVGEIILACDDNPKPLITMAPEETVQPTPPTTTDIFTPRREVITSFADFGPSTSFTSERWTLSTTTVKTITSTDVRFVGFIDNEDGEEKDRRKVILKEFNKENNSMKPNIISREEILEKNQTNEKNETISDDKKIFSAEVIGRETGKVGRVIDEVGEFKAKDYNVKQDNKNAISYGVSSHETKEATKIKCHYNKMDIVVILDASTSRKEVFDAQRELTLSLIEKLPIYKENDKVGLGIISFTSEPIIRQELSYVKSKEESRHAVEDIEYKGGSTRTSMGIELAISELELKRRYDAFQVIVLMNDGMSQDEWPVVQATASRLHNCGAHVFGVAMGHDVDFRELNLYISEKGHMFRDNQTEAFLNAITSLLDTGVEENCHQFEDISQVKTTLIMFSEDEMKGTSKVPYIENNDNERGRTFANNVLNLTVHESKKYVDNGNKLEEIHEENTESCSQPDIDLVVIFDTAASPDSKDSDIIQQNRYLLTDLIGTLPVNDRLKMSIITFEETPKVIHEFSNEQDKKHLYISAEKIIPKEGEPSYSKAVDAGYEYYTKNKRETARGMFLIMGDGKTNDQSEDRSALSNMLRRDKNVTCYALHSGIDMDKRSLRSYTGDDDKIYNFKRNIEFMELLIKKIKAGDSDNCRRAKAVLNKNDTTFDEQTYLTFKEKHQIISLSKDIPDMAIEDITVSKDGKIILNDTSVEDNTCLIDLILLIDTSSSVKNVFKKEIEIASNIVNQLKIGSKHAQVSIIKISSDINTKVSWSFTSPQDKKLILKSLSNIKYLGGKSSIHKALLLASNEIKLQNETRILKTTPIAVVISDGFDSEDLEESAKLFRDVVPNVYAISITDEIPYNLRELEKITDNSNRVFTTENLSDFFTIFEHFTMTC